MGEYVFIVFERGTGDISKSLLAGWPVSTYVALSQQ